MVGKERKEMRDWRKDVRKTEAEREGDIKGC